jgi:hypothetical protein
VSKAALNAYSRVLARRHVYAGGAWSCCSARSCRRALPFLVGAGRRAPVMIGMAPRRVWPAIIACQCPRIIARLDWPPALARPWYRHHVRLPNRLGGGHNPAHSNSQPRHDKTGAAGAAAERAAGARSPHAAVTPPLPPAITVA